VSAIQATSDLWWKNAIVYCVDVGSYLDTNADGVGDLRGLTQRLDYLAGIGITCLWLQPFYPSPRRDNGYDITDYYAVDPRYGSLGDLVELVRTARERGIRVIADLVVNHTSIDHPWFQAAGDRDSPFHDYYVWSDERPPDAHEGVIFPGSQESIWSYDKRADRWYMHRFYHHQPDLNIANPVVRDEIHKVIGFWLELGLSGFRVDAVPFLIEQEGIASPATGDPHDYLRDLRAFMSRRRGDAVLLAEANEPAEKLALFFGDEHGDQMHVLFSFIGNQAMYLSLVRGDARPMAKALRSLPDPPPGGQWASFVRNHDELSLDKLSDAEREEVFAAFAPDPDMRLYERGIRRRFPSMVAGDRRRMELMYALMFAMPGTPSSTARRSAWATTSHSRGVTRCGPACSGAPRQVAVSHGRPVRRCSDRPSRADHSATSGSMCSGSGRTPRPFSTGWNVSSGPAASGRRSAGERGASSRPVTMRSWHWPWIGKMAAWSASTTSLRGAPPCSSRCRAPRAIVRGGTSWGRADAVGRRGSRKRHSTSPLARTSTTGSAAEAPDSAPP